MQFLLNTLVFKVWLPIGDREKNERGESPDFKMPWKSLRPEGDGLATMAAVLCLHIVVRAAISHQCTDPQYLKDRIFIAHPSSPKWCKLL